jgi:hypothetical protein
MYQILSIVSKMKYDKFWVFSFFFVIVLWAFVLIPTLSYVIMSENVLIDTDIDLRVLSFYVV